MAKGPTQKEIEAQLDRLRGILIIATEGVYLGVVLQCLGELSTSLIVGAAADKQAGMKAVEEYCVGLIRTAADIPDEIFDMPLTDEEPDSTPKVTVN